MDRADSLPVRSLLRQQRQQVSFLSSDCTHFKSNNAPSVWYSQCLPIAQNNPQQSSSLAEVRTLTTAITIDGPFPTVITTRITYLQPRPSSTPPVEVVTVTLVPDEPCEHDFYC